MTEVRLDGLFASALRGEPGALDRLLDLELPRLYDYMMRMTGNVSRSSDAIDQLRHETFAKEVKQLGGGASFTDFRVHLYRAARSMCADVWDADTTHLINLALGEKPEDIDSGSKESLSEKTPRPGAFVDDHIRLDRALRALPPWERETIVLRLRCGFDDDAIQSIMQASKATVETNFRSGLAYIQQALKDLSITMTGASTALTMVMALEGHPLPDGTSHNTQDLSVMMHALKESRTGRFGGMKRWFVLALVLGALAWGLWPRLKSFF